MTEEKDLANEIKSKFNESLGDNSEFWTKTVNEQKKEIEELKRDIEEIKNPPPRKMTEKQAAGEFIDHMDSCTDNNCSIHNMKDDMQKKALIKGFVISQAKNKMRRN